MAAKSSFAGCKTVENSAACCVAKHHAAQYAALCSTFELLLMGFAKPAMFPGTRSQLRFLYMYCCLCSCCHRHGCCLFVVVYLL